MDPPLLRERECRDRASQSCRISASFFLRLQPLICLSQVNASSRVESVWEVGELDGASLRGVPNECSIVVLCDTVLKVVGVASVVGSIGAPENVHKEAHILAIGMFCNFFSHSAWAIWCWACLPPFDKLRTSGTSFDRLRTSGTSNRSS